MNTEGERLKLIRNFLGLSGEKFAEKLGIPSRQYYSKYETNSILISREILKKLFEDYNINIHWLLFGNGEMFIKNSQIMEQVETKVKTILSDYGVIPPKA